jgi:type 1 glutamine amidotransferase
MRRRDLLLTAAAGALGAAEARKRKVLYFTRSAGFEHSVVRRQGAQLSHSEKLLVEFGRRGGFEVECTKDGRVFDASLDQYDVIAFYTSGDLTGPSKDGSPPMTAAGKRKLLEAIAGGKGFAGIHSATDTFHSPGPRDQNQSEIDPYIAMLGGEFVTHGAQQEASLLLTSPKFPGAGNLGIAEGMPFTDEWYTFKNFARDLHVILVQETEYMKGEPYQRPDFPATWARFHGRGRVFYTSLGHREDIWTNPFFQAIVLGGLGWAGGGVEFDIQPNLDAVTPRASQLKGS